MQRIEPHRGGAGVRGHFREFAQRRENRPRPDRRSGAGVKLSGDAGQARAADGRSGRKHWRGATVRWHTNSGRAFGKEAVTPGGHAPAASQAPCPRAARPARVTLPNSRLPGSSRMGSVPPSSRSKISAAGSAAAARRESQADRLALICGQRRGQRRLFSQSARRARLSRASALLARGKAHIGEQRLLRRVRDGVLFPVDVVPVSAMPAARASRSRKAEATPPCPGAGGMPSRVRLFLEDRHRARLDPDTSRRQRNDAAARIAVFARRIETIAPARAALRLRQHHLDGLRPGMQHGEDAIRRLPDPSSAARRVRR